MRVSLRNQYSSFLFNLQNTQSRLMELNMQASSQKRINRPSDDAAGAGKVVNLNASIAKLKQYRAIATRYDKTACNFLGGIHLAASLIWMI